MDCPIDNTTLETRTVHDVQIKECPECRGLWFEAGELREAKDAADPDLRWLDFDLWSDHEVLTAEWSNRKCPVCRFTMMRIAYGDTGVTVDYCQDGHGVWLDKGEFEAIVAALENEVTTKDVSDYAGASLEEAQELITGDEGFLSEWKDFLTVTRLLQYRLLAENPRLAELFVALNRSNPLK
ncbi:MAG TPA: zf-TFIIB domain-containing protein [Anaerolineales bacterium]|nr:zf-TFIIB domain-containing protein [Anaerolineales bacterium]